MARALMLALCGPLVAGCFHGRTYSAASTQAKWRSIEASSGRPAGGAPPSPTSGPVTADEVYALAAERNVDVVAAAASADAAAAEIGEARQLDNPQLRITGFNVDDALANQTQMTIGLRVPIPRPGTIRADVEAAKQNAAGERALSEEAKRWLRDRVYKRFALLTKLQADLEQAKKATALRAERREQIAARSEMRVATSLDVAMADVLHAESLQLEARIADEITAVEAELAGLAGLPAGTRFVADGDALRVTDLDLDRDELVELAMASRPELRTAQAEVAEAEAEAHVAKSQACPWFDWAQVQYRATPDASPSAFGFGVAITLPIFSWNRGAIKAAKASVRRRELEERARIVAVASEVDAALLRVERTAARIEQLDAELMPKVEAARREAEAALAGGAIDPIVASEVDNQRVAAERLRLQALLEHREAVIDLETAVGASLTGGRGGGRAQ